MKLNEDETTSSSKIKMKRKYKQIAKSEKHHRLNKQVLLKAQDCIDYMQKKGKMSEKVTRGFVTNVVELSNAMVDRLKGSNLLTDEKDDSSMNLMFVKPSKDFYNRLMGIWLKFDHK